MPSPFAGVRPMRTIVSPTRIPARSAGPGRSETTTYPAPDGRTLTPMPP